MDRYICIHGHFYQPPRENPWLEEVEIEDSARPYHDWNERITAHCYRPNTASRILDADKKIVDIVSNYSQISFNFGPTLLAWLQRHAPDVYQAILDADTQSQKNFSGHGSALAQAYNHIIMPLANTEDRRTEVIWGLQDFRHRFQREPEGMWLPETAVDLETLDILAQHGIKFTILAPRQVGRIREIGKKSWQKVTADKLDTTRPYLCNLPSGKKISSFFFDAPISQAVSYNGILASGENFARKLVDRFDETNHDSPLVNIASDGETYGHHHRYGDMALAYCLHYIRRNNLARVTNYAEYLEKHPPAWEVEIIENTSWSCAHGVERWRSDCSCHTGRPPTGHQKWRAPLRRAMDYLRDNLTEIYREKMSRYTADPIDARNRYIEVLLDRSEENMNRYLGQITARELTHEEKFDLLKLLEMQRHSLLMYTSCGWFFDDVSGIESVQIMRYAARAAQLAKETAGRDLELAYIDILHRGPSNSPDFADAGEVYDRLVKSATVDLHRVGAHLALSAVFEDYPEKTDLYCFSVHIRDFQRLEAGAQTLALGRADLRSKITLEDYCIDFAVLQFGDHNITGAVAGRLDDHKFKETTGKLKDAFLNADTAEVMNLMNTDFGGRGYSLRHLFKDKQQEILTGLLQTTYQDLEADYRRIYEHNYTLLLTLSQMQKTPPAALAEPARFVLTRDLLALLEAEAIDTKKFQAIVEEARRLSLKLDTDIITFEAEKRLAGLADSLNRSAEDTGTLNAIEQIVSCITTLAALDLQPAQNIVFNLTKTLYPQMQQKAEQSDPAAKKWLSHFQSLADNLAIKLP